MPFSIVRNDITRITADAIVNTANPKPVIGSGTDRAIYEAAGADRLLAERKKIGEIAPGSAVSTPAFDLNAQYIIHTVGPVWQGGEAGELEVLGSCYRHSLLLADYLGCKSIAFPMISTGTYGFPKDKALDVALEEISDFLTVSEMNVTLVVFDKTSFDLSQDLMDDVRQYIDDNYAEEQREKEYPEGAGNVYSRRMSDTAGFRMPEPDSSESGMADSDEDEMAPLAAIEEEVSLMTEEDFDAYFNSLYEESISEGPSLPDSDAAPSYKGGDAARQPFEPLYSPSTKAGSPFGKSYEPVSNLQEAMRALGQTFQEKLLSLIDEKGYSDTQVYKKANIDRKLFSKIRCNVNYKPSKATVLALSIALELNLDETVDLLKRAGLALQPSSMSDVIVEYCIGKEIYDIYEVNALLFKYDQQLLGA